MAFNQDDARERAMVAALNLQQDPDRVRHDADAYLNLELDGAPLRIEFECKSSPVSSDFGTGRDTGMRQLQRWSRMHFVFGWFEPRDNQPVRMWYGSPAMMRSWNESEQAYLKPDLEIVSHAPDGVDQAVVDALLGPGEEFTYEQINAIIKNQWNAKASVGRPNLYKLRADIFNRGPSIEFRYSRAMAECAVRDRIAYLLDRGSTVNNRKISARYIQEHCVEIGAPRWAAELAKHIDDALRSAPPS
jgi:hypothetical protein